MRGRPANDILVVDDDASIRLTLTLIPEDEGYEVTTAVNGVEALNAIDHNPPVAMLLEIQMSAIDGVGVVTRLREQGRWVSTIGMTATTQA